jgi:adenylyltransferase/sulfurtransferase
MGVGHLGIVDGDTVSISNLQRQILYGREDVGKHKTEVAREKVHQQNPDVQVNLYTEELSALNVFDLISGYDIILDCTDQFKARYIINDACVLLHKPFIFAAVYQYEGQLAVFNGMETDANYRDLFPQSPAKHDASNCAEAGVFAITTALIGTLQAGEAIKWITGIGKVLRNQLLTYDVRQHISYTVEIPKQAFASLGVPKNQDELKSYPYNTFCGLSSPTNDEIDAAEFEYLLTTKNIQLIDIRNRDELPKLDELQALRIPINELEQHIEKIDKEKKVILFCHSGHRTQIALEVLQEEYQMKNVCHLKGGLLRWIDYKSTKP